MRISNAGVELNVEVDGPDGARPVLLMHGILASAETWRWLLPDLADHRVFRLDFRGHGASDRAPGAYLAADYLSDAIAVCEQLAGAPVAAIGHSLGGVTAAALAQLRPDLVELAILEDPPLRRPGGSPGSAGDAEHSLAATFGLARQMIPQIQAAGSGAQDVATLMGAMPGATGVPMGQVLHPDGLLAMAEGMLAVDATVLDPVLDGTIEFVFDITRPVDVPLTVVAADPALPDAVTQPADLTDIASVNPSATTKTIDGAGHLIHDTRGARESFGELVRATLDRT